MKKRKLIYILDPHCGWSYANARSIKDLRDFYQDEFDLELLSAGMWIGADVKRGGEAMYDFILPSVMRIKQYHDVDIDGPYLDLIKDSTYLLSSEWASKAIMAVKLIAPEKVLNYSYKLMEQQFNYGNRYDVEKTYLNALEDLEIDKALFSEVWKSENVKENTVKMFEKANMLTSSYPTLFLQDENGLSEIQKGIFNIGDIISKIETLAVKD